MDPQFSSYSALLAAANRTQSLTQPLQSIEEWPATVTNIARQRHMGIHNPFVSSLVVFVYLLLVSQQWRTERIELARAHPCRATWCSGQKKNYLANTKSIRQHWGLNEVDLSVIKHSQISVGELLNPRAPSQQHRDISPKQHKSWKPSKQWQRDSREKQLSQTGLRDTGTHTHTHVHAPLNIRHIQADIFIHNHIHQVNAETHTRHSPINTNKHLTAETIAMH